MGDTGDSKNNLIKHIFETMNYGDDVENLSQGIEWLKNKENHIFAYVDKKDEAPNGEVVPIHNATTNKHLCNVHVPDSATVDTILKKVSESKNAWAEIPPIKRSEIIYKLGTEIQKKQDLFIQLEITIRGILSKDTKTKALPLLTDFLHYYSSFTVNCNAENTFTPKGLVVAVLPDFNSLATLGTILGPCLSSGCQLILQTDPKLSVATHAVIELATEAGVPEGTIRLIPGSVDPNAFFVHPGVSTVAIFDDLYKEKYLIANPFNKKILHFNSSGASTIVFENCDLDSACHSVVDSAFGYNGMLPWSIRNVFVQENIFEAFIHKLKYRTGKLKVGSSNKKNVDVSHPDNNILEKVEKIIQNAKNAGVEVYKPNTDFVVPCLLIGSNVFPNNVIKEDFLNVPLVTVLAFRSINEAVSLANNSRQGLAVSVWTESTSLVNEIIGKLKFGNVWVNSHGLFDATIATSPYKSSGNAYFGGNQGFYEYLQTKVLKDGIISQVTKGEVMEKAIVEAKKAQGAWSKLSNFERMKNLQVAAQNLEKDNKSGSLPEKWIDQWVTLIHECVLTPSVESFAKLKAFNVVTTQEPHGIIAIETADNKDDHNKRLIIAAINAGNSVILLNNCEETTAFYSNLSKSLPKGVFTVIANSQDVTKVAALHKELNVYFGERSNKVFGSLPLKSSNKFKVASDNWKEVREKVSLVKNVWLNKGQSFM